MSKHTDQAMERIRLRLEEKALLAEEATDTSDTVKPVKKAPPKDNTDNKDDSDNTDDSEDTDDSDDESEKQFPPTAEIKPLCDQIEAFGDQMYIISELVKQVEGFRGENKTDMMKDALSGLRDAMKETVDMQGKLKDGLTGYLTKYKDGLTTPPVASTDDTSKSK